MKIILAAAAVIRLTVTALPAKPHTSGDAAAGREAYAAQCPMCHASEAGKPAGARPNLHGVDGRKAGATEYAYSLSLKAAGLPWERQSLASFLEDSRAKVSATRMRRKVDDPKMRADMQPICPR